MCDVNQTWALRQSESLTSGHLIFKLCNQKRSILLGGVESSDQGQEASTQKGNELMGHHHLKSEKNYSSPSESNPSVTRQD